MKDTLVGDEASVILENTFYKKNYGSITGFGEDDGIYSYGNRRGNEYKSPVSSIKNPEEERFLNADIF